MKKITVKNVMSGIRKIIKFGPFIPISNLVLTYGNRYLPQQLLDFISERRNKLIEDRIIRIIGLPSAPERNASSGGDKIWVLWLQGEEHMPLIPKMCLASIRKYANGHEVVVLSLNNLKEYIQLPVRILKLYNKGNITATHFSDIIRLAILSEHGGFWLDSTMYLTAPIDEAVFHSKVFSMKSEPFGYFVSECRWAGFCIYMNRCAVLPHLLRNMIFEYWNKEDWLIDYFMIDYIIYLAVKYNCEAAIEINEIPYNNPHLHAMSSLLCNNFDEKLFARLIQDTSFFKLTWKNFSDNELLSNPQNFYYKMLQLTQL